MKELFLNFLIFKRIIFKFDEEDQNIMCNIIDELIHERVDVIGSAMANIALC